MINSREEFVEKFKCGQRICLSWWEKDRWLLISGIGRNKFLGIERDSQEISYCMENGWYPFPYNPPKQKVKKYRYKYWESHPHKTEGYYKDDKDFQENGVRAKDFIRLDETMREFEE